MHDGLEPHTLEYKGSRARGKVRRPEPLLLLLIIIIRKKPHTGERSTWLEGRNYVCLGLGNGMEADGCLH